MMGCDQQHGNKVAFVKKWVSVPHTNSLNYIAAQFDAVK